MIFIRKYGFLEDRVHMEFIAQYSNGYTEYPRLVNAFGRKTEAALFPVPGSWLLWKTKGPLSEEPLLPVLFRYRDCELILTGLLL
jgi:hypothetical protein